MGHLARQQCTLTAGMVLFLVALRPVLETVRERASRERVAEVPADVPATSPSALAFSPLAFPTYRHALRYRGAHHWGDAGPDDSDSGRVGLWRFCCIFLAMLFADRILKAPFVAPALGIVGAVLGVLQIALGVQAAADGLRMMGIVGRAKGGGGGGGGGKGGGGGGGGARFLSVGGRSAVSVVPAGASVPGRAPAAASAGDSHLVASHGCRCCCCRRLRSCALVRWVAIPLFYDIEATFVPDCAAHVIVAELIVHRRVRNVVRQFLERGVVHPKRYPSLRRRSSQPRGCATR